MSYRVFISEAKTKSELNEFLKVYLKDAGYGGVQLAKTPLGTTVSIAASRPGLVIGPGGRNIRELGEVLESRFSMKNSQINVVEVEKPFLDPEIVASRICDALEKGVRYRRVIRWALKKVTDSGALGVQIKVSGKLSSDRSRFANFTVGYVPSSGDMVLKSVRRATKNVLLPQGLIGVKVKILPQDAKLPDRFKISIPSLDAPHIKVNSVENARDEKTNESSIEPSPETIEIKAEKNGGEKNGKEE